MHRRDLLAGATSGLVLGALGTAGLVAGTACTAETPYPPALLAAPALLAVMGATQIRAIGRRYLDSAPEEQSAEQLLAAITRTARSARDWPWSPVPTLEALIAADFSADRTVLPDGWLLSVTEARQCALYALRSA